jgi:hypothetical protein
MKKFNLRKGTVVSTFFALMKEWDDKCSDNYSKVILVGNTLLVLKRRIPKNEVKYHLKRRRLGTFLFRVKGELKWNWYKKIEGYLTTRRSK